MDIYASEKEQVEALKKWFEENRLALLLGIVLGLGGLFGYQFWQQRVTSTAEAASGLYQDTLEALRAGQADKLAAARGQLQAEYANTPYAALAALAEAHLMTRDGNLDGARPLVEWAVANAEQPEVVAVARLRLARLQLDGGQPDEALATLDTLGDVAAYKAQVTELRGDIHLHQGARTQAAEAYREALAQGGENRVVLRMKLDDLGVDKVEE